MKIINWFYHNLTSLLGQVADRCRGEIEVTSFQGAQHNCVRDIAGSENSRVKFDNLKKMKCPAMHTWNWFKKIIASQNLTYSFVLQLCRIRDFRAQHGLEGGLCDNMLNKYWGDALLCCFNILNWDVDWFKGLLSTDLWSLNNLTSSLWWNCPCLLKIQEYLIFSYYFWTAVSLPVLLCSRFTCLLYWLVIISLFHAQFHLFCQINVQKSGHW